MKKLILPLLALMAVFGVDAQIEFDNSQKLRVAEAIINNYYVEDVDSDTITDEAIRAMLKTLDPHSAYSTSTETKEFTEPLEGKFSGIGIQFNMLEDTVYVLQTIAGGPSERVGILPGDRIVKADTSVIAGKKYPNTKVMKYLRGPKGSPVRLNVKRGEEYIDFDLVRDDIPLYSVDETFMADPTTGYIRVTRFAEDTPREVRDAIKKLRKKGMKNLIVDLGSNGGGYLGAAFEMAGEFLPLGTPVVSTEGRRSPKQVYTTDRAGDFDGRVVVLTDQYSASAAEIFSGAMQDNDRGVVVGRRTFGKGLVQRPFPFPDGSMIRLTISRYYTPSGRCIQKHYDKGHGEEYVLDMLNRYNSGELWSADSIRKSEDQLFYTLKSHRPVYGGGGIIPDVFVPADTSYYSTYYRDLVAKGLINKVSIGYVDANRSALAAAYPDDDSFHANFEVPEELLQKLIGTASDSGVEFKEEQWERSLPMVKAILKGIIARDIHDDGSYFRALVPINKDFQEALRVIRDEDLYNSILAGKTN